MGKVEIQVKFNNLLDAKEDLLKVASAVESRKLDFQFSKAEGEAVNELTVMAGRLRSYGQTFAVVIRHTAEKLEYTAATFKEMDDSLNY